MLKPYPFQIKDIEKLVAHDGTGIVATQVGGGKTLIAVEVAKKLNTKTNFVIAPKGTHKSAWKKTIEWQVPNANVRFINSTKEGNKAFLDLESGEAGWYLITPEFFRNYHWKGVTPDFAVFDEIHRASNRNSKTAKMLHTLKAKRRLGMSGTIAGNKVEGFWSVLKWIYPEVAGRGFWNWVEMFCETKMDIFAGKVVEAEKVPGGIVGSIPCYIRHLKREQCCELHPNGIDHELPAVQEEIRMVELLPEQKRIYKKLEKELFVWLGDNPLFVEAPIAVRTRLRQITLGVPIIDEETGQVTFAEDCKSTKLIELFQIIEDHPAGEQMLLLTHSQKFAAITAQRLNKMNLKAFEWSGSKSQKQRDDALDKFKAGEIQFIVAVIAAIGEGTDGLQEASNVVVWLSEDDNRILNEQASGRLDRRGQTKSVISYKIIAEDTYDEGQFSRLIQDRMRMNETLRAKDK
jgi:SNF2 family DNA or RNA helicase